MASEGSHDTNIVINDTLLTGIQNISFQQNYNEEPVSLLGNAFSTTAVSSPPSTTAKIDKLLLNRDFITGLSGSTGISGQFIYGTNMMAFDSATLDGFSLSVAMGSNPAISFDFTVYGDMSGNRNDTTLAGSKLNTAQKDNTIAEISQTGLQVVFDEAVDIGGAGKTNSNAVQSFNFTETYQYQPKYKIGDHKPCQVDLINPIEQSATIAIEVEDHFFKNKYDSIPGFGTSSNYRDKNVKLTMRTRNGDTNVFELQNAHLVSETISAGVGDSVVANLTYRGHKKLGS